MTAEVRGRGMEKKTGENLIGCTIYIKELKTGTTTGLDGSFALKKIPMGDYTIIGTYIGYATIEQQISLTRNDTLITLNFNFVPFARQLDEVEINGLSNKNTDKSARFSERNADNIINVISAKTIELSPDLTVANVIQRVSGVTIERTSTGDGQYAILRGMDKRYNYTMVNGVKIPGTNNKYRYVSLDIFPSALIDRLEVTKTLTADMEGDAIGGVTNMVMKDAPEKWQVTLNFAGGYNQLFFDRPYTGFNFSVINYRSPYEINGINYTATPADFTTQNLDPESYTPRPNLVGDFSAGSRFFKNKLGIIVAGSYSNTYRGANSLVFGTENDTNNLPELTGKSNRKISERSTQYGAHAKIDFRLNAHHDLSLYSTYMNLTTSQVRESESTDFTNSSNSLLGYSLRFRLNNQQLLNMVLQGEHRFWEKLRIQWSGVYSYALNQTPDYINLSLFNEISNGTKLPLTVSNSGSTRRWEHNSDKDWAGYLNLAYTPHISGTQVEFSAGGLYRSKTRTSFYNEYIFFAVLNTDYKSMQGRDWDHFSEIKWKNTVDLNNTDPLNFNASEKIAAGYLQVKFPGRKLQVVGGLRVENTDQEYMLKYTKGDVPPMGNQVYNDFLPSLHLKYMPADKHNIRASYFRSINRPGFLEIVPYLVVSEDFTEMGNPAIKHTIADNFDLRYEFFPKPLDQLMAGVFYKIIQDPIEYGWSNPQGSKGNIYYMPDNYGDATNYGAEIDFIKFFRFIGIKANYTYTHSQITSWKRFRVRKEDGWQLDSAQQTRPLYGQSAHVVNLSLLFRDTRSGWDAQLSGNYTGDRIYLISRFYEDDQWQRGYIQMDASVEKRFKNGLSLYFKAKNLLNSPMEVYIQKVNPVNDEFIEKNTNSKETLVRQDFYMQSYLLGIRYEFK